MCTIIPWLPTPTEDSTAIATTRDTTVRDIPTTSFAPYALLKYVDVIAQITSDGFTFMFGYVYGWLVHQHPSVIIPSITKTRDLDNDTPYRCTLIHCANRPTKQLVRSDRSNRFLCEQHYTSYMCLVTTGYCSIQCTTERAMFGIYSSNVKTVYMSYWRVSTYRDIIEPVDRSSGEDVPNPVYRQLADYLVYKTWLCDHVLGSLIPRELCNYIIWYALSGYTQHADFRTSLQ